MKKNNVDGIIQSLNYAEKVIRNYKIFLWVILEKYGVIDIPKERFDDLVNNGCPELTLIVLNDGSGFRLYASEMPYDK